VIRYGLPATLWPPARLYAAVTPSVAKKPESDPVKTGSTAPYVLLAAFGVTDAVALLMAKLAVLYVTL
jgi:hypothetical protein